MNAEGQTVGYSYTSGGDAPACSTNCNYTPKSGKWLAAAMKKMMTNVR